MSGGDGFDRVVVVVLVVVVVVLFFATSPSWSPLSSSCPFLQLLEAVLLFIIAVVAPDTSLLSSLTMVLHFPCARLT